MQSNAIADPLLDVFNYLSNSERLKAGLACKLWHRTLLRFWECHAKAMYPNLWQHWSASYSFHQIVFGQPIWESLIKLTPRAWHSVIAQLFPLRDLKKGEVCHSHKEHWLQIAPSRDPEWQSLVITLCYPDSSLVVRDTVYCSRLRNPSSWGAPRSPVVHHETKCLDRHGNVIYYIPAEKIPATKERHFFMKEDEQLSFLKQLRVFLVPSGAPEAPPPHIQWSKWTKQEHFSCLTSLCHRLQDYFQ